MRWLLAFVIVVAALPVMADNKAWLNGKVVDAGYLSDNNGELFPVVTVVLSDSHSYMEVWAVDTNASGLLPFGRKPKVDLRVGAEFKAYRTGETRYAPYGYLVIQYQDAKGRTRSEEHIIAKGLGVEDIPR